MADAKMDQVQKLVDQRMTGIEGARARDQFVAQKMHDLPTLYQQQMPLTTDPAALAAAEQTIRAQFREDFQAMTKAAAAMGHLPPNLYEPEALAKAAAKASAPPDPHEEGWMGTARRALAGEDVAPKPVRPASSQVDTSNMSGVQMIAASLRGEADPRAAYK